ncbi:hypothetical protein Clacol_002801 [Clathrus columnatus]|uniref:Peptidase M24 domain-containing protein n=1 Tax=Clathrus columnatus TaxID=1419009 RepID=A0AAV5A1S3_9AGAM|nr:hypothetical protein Clacol_002801 [Clathrus columnatus]
MSEPIKDLKEEKKEDKHEDKAAELTKYKTAADIVHNATKKIIELAVEGAKVIDLCIEGDKLIEQGTAAVYNKGGKGGKISKGIELSDPQSSLILAKDDVVKIHLGAHIDGFASISAETIIVGATEQEPATGRRADVVKAAWHAAELAMRLIKVDNKNWGVTENVNKIVSAWDCKAVEGMLSCQHSKNVIDGKKRIILAPTQEQRSGLDTVTFAEGEVYGVDILVSSAEDGKAGAREEETRTTVYQRVSDVTYLLKMKTSRAVFSEVQKKAGAFPFNVRMLDDEKRGRMGLQEATQHGLVRSYEVLYTPANTFVAQFHFTIALLPGGPSLISHPPIWYKPELVKTEKELEDTDLQETLLKKLRESKKSKKKKTKAEETEVGETEKVE